MNPPVQQDEIRQVRLAFEAALGIESKVAHEHRSSHYFTTSRGHNVGRDEQLALIYAQRLRLTPLPEEIDDCSAYLKRLLDELETEKRNFRASEEDPEGFGIATLHGLSRVLEGFAKRAAQALGSGWERLS
jgi:hypothetical protein